MFESSDIEMICPFVASSLEDAIESLMDSAASHEHGARRECPNSQRNLAAKARFDLACKTEELLRSGNRRAAQRLLAKHNITVRHPICT